MESTLKDIDTRFWYKLPDDLISILMSLGFTHGDIFVIVCLFRHTKPDEHISEVSLKQIKKYTRGSPRGIYNTINRLKNEGLVVKMGKDLWDVEGLIKTILERKEQNART